MKTFFFLYMTLLWGGSIKNNFCVRLQMRQCVNKTLFHITGILWSTGLSLLPVIPQVS